jgi:DNA-binding protein H-NS
MALNDTVKNLRNLLSHITHDLEKAERGNKAASQRVRTGTVKLEKIAKLYRKESIKTERSFKGKKPAKKAAKPAKKPASKPAKKAAHKPRALSLKKATAKLPARRAAR